MTLSLTDTFSLKSIALFLLFTVRACCFAVEDTNIIAAGDWSKPVSDFLGYTLRGRLLLCDSPKDKVTAVYLALQECSESWGGCLEVYCNMKPTVTLVGHPDSQGRDHIEKAAAAWQLRDSSDKLVPDSGGWIQRRCAGSFMDYVAL